MSNLVIVESPTKAKTLTKILTNTKVLSTKGHFLELSKDYLTKDQRQEGWPVQGVDKNFDPDWKTVYGSAKIIDGIKKEAKKADKIYIATDPDREGEGIGYHVQQVLLESGISEKKNKKVYFS